VGRVNHAIVLGTKPGAETPVAGLPLAVRAVLALGDAGFDDIGLAVPGRPRWAAAPLARHGAAVRWIASPPTKPALPSDLGDGLTLLLAGDVLVDARAVAGLRDAAPGAVWSATGALVGVVCARSEVATCLQRPDLCTRSPGSGAQISSGLAVPLSSPDSRGSLERALVDSLTHRGTSDSYLATLIDRPISRLLTRLALRTPLAPWHVTLLSMVAGLLGAAGLATVSYWGRLGGVLLLVLSVVLDCVDGDMARAQLAQSPAGARLDLVGDYLVHAAVFTGLAIGLLREGLAGQGTWVVLALVTGVGAAMIAVHVLFIHPALRHGGDLHWDGGPESLRGRPGASIVEKVASRDYTYLLLALALVGHLEWFLYAAAAGAWLFTLGVVAYGFVAAPRSREAAR
jgi:phosphatidylglycerophosphate synthase